MKTQAPKVVFKNGDVRVLRFRSKGMVSYTAAIPTSGGETQIPGFAKTNDITARRDLIEHLRAQDYNMVANTLVKDGFLVKVSAKPIKHKQGPLFSKYPGTNGHDLYTARITIAPDYTPTLEIANTRRPGEVVKMDPLVGMAALDLLAALKEIADAPSYEFRAMKAESIARAAIAKAEVH